MFLISYCSLLFVIHEEAPPSQGRSMHKTMNYQLWTNRLLLNSSLISPLYFPYGSLIPQQYILRGSVPYTAWVTNIYCVLLYKLFRIIFTFWSASRHWSIYYSQPPESHPPTIEFHVLRFTFDHSPLTIDHSITPRRGWDWGLLGNIPFNELYQLFAGNITKAVKNK